MYWMLFVPNKMGERRRKMDGVFAPGSNKQLTAFVCCDYASRFSFSLLWDLAVVEPRFMDIFFGGALTLPEF